MTTAWKLITPGAIEVDGRLMFVGYRKPIPPKPERLARTRFIVQAVNAHEDLLAACKLALAGEADDDTIFNALADAVAKAERKEVKAL
ncbi:MAG: hypothetical protein FJ121_11415 [Deltaproteobacteria bacterium]|nr:hypothetical protein [Deltaproteobacteria bacterium]